MIFGGGLAASYVVNTQVLNLRDTFWVLVLPGLVSSFNVTISRTFFRTTIPDSIIESAKMDGASQGTIFFKIVLPIACTYPFFQKYFISGLTIGAVKG